MKKFVVCFRTVMYLLALTLGFQSCDKDDDPVTNDKGQVLAVIYDNAEQNENWGMTPSAYSVWNRANRSER